ncbi:MAG: tryptophan 2,3-dioxygenase [Proteobacteria bacterium]|nr:MAG: tryptophan 2,3-dioxygenase [Pseudomonadota bacterium]
MQDYKDFTKPGTQSVTYGKYLKVHELLALQEELSEPKAHDELLFITIHQTYELWFKQILHELDQTQTYLDGDKLPQMMKGLERINRIMRVLVSQVEILESMTPNEFNRFRGHLSPASGFQSFQFRVLEFRLGMKNYAHLKFFEHEPEAHAAIAKAMSEKTFYDHWFAYLKRRGLPIPDDVLLRDVTVPYEAHTEVSKIFVEFYKDTDKYFDLYVASEALFDLDELLIQWRFRHVQMVQRMIGNMGGTGGSHGARYLQSTLSKSAFPELWDLRNLLGK